jgi:hypothetical protein
MMPMGAIDMIAASAGSWPRPVSHGLIPSLSFSSTTASVANRRSGSSRSSQTRA